MRSALSERLREGNLIIIDEIRRFTNPKTKEFLVAIGWFGIDREQEESRAKTLIVDSLDNENLVLSSRNVEKTKVTNSFGLNIYDILYHEKLLISKAAVEELTNCLIRSVKASSEGESVAPVVEEGAERRRKKLKP